jgi:hypothetical protein
MKDINMTASGEILETSEVTVILLVRWDRHLCTPRSTGMTLQVGSQSISAVSVMTGMICSVNQCRQQRATNKASQQASKPAASQPAVGLPSTRTRVGSGRRITGAVIQSWKSRRGIPASDGKCWAVGQPTKTWQRGRPWHRPAKINTALGMYLRSDATAS